MRAKWLATTAVAMAAVAVPFLAGCSAGVADGPSADGQAHQLSFDASERVWVFEQQHGGCVESPLLADLERTIRRLTLGSRRVGFWRGDVPITARLLRSERPNAFALASGHVYVTTGLFDVICTDDDLAAVLAHELAHIEDMQGSQPYGLTSDQRLFVETEADSRAVELLLAARFQPLALSDMVGRLTDEQPEGWARYRCEMIAHRLGAMDEVGDRE